MKVAIDFRGFKKSGAGGLSLYVELLLKHLLKKKCYVLILALKDLKISDLNIKKNQEKFITIANLDTTSSRASKENLNLDLNKITSIITKYGADIYHACTNHGTSSDKISVPTILTVHDIIPLSIREGSATKKENYFIYKKLIKSSIKNADKIISISEYTKNKLIEKFNINAKKIKIIYNGGYIGHTKQILSEKEGNKYLDDNKIIKEKYFVYIGGFYERKNILRLVDAFKKIYKKYPQYKLVVTGDNEYNDYSKNQYKKYLKHVGNCKGIKFLGYVSDKEKNYLIKNAKALVYPSVYEGFGLPIIEAMSLKTSVLCSDNTVLPEIGGDIPYYFNPYKVDDIYKQIKKIINEKDEKLEDKIKKGVKRAKLFTWDKWFRQIYSLYEKMINEKPKVSIIMPVYNREKFIKKSIQSILDQTYSNFELIIIDDGSTDDTSKIIKSFKDDRIKYFYHPNKGEYYSTNVGFKKAQGRYITWVHSDDMVPPKSLEYRVKALNSNKLIEIVHGNIIKINLADETRKTLMATSDNHKQVFNHYCWDEDYRTHKKYYVHHLTFMFRKSVIDKVGYFDESIKGFAGDLDWMMRALKVCKIKKINKVLYYYCRHKQTISNILEHKKNTKNITRRIQKRYCKNITF